MSETKLFMSRGVKHGLYRTFDYGKGGKFKCLGTHGSDGVKTGLHWIGKPGGAFLVASLDENGSTADGHAVYLYPNLTLAVVATFDKGKMKSGRYADVGGGKGRDKNGFLWHQICLELACKIM